MKHFSSHIRSCMLGVFLLASCSQQQYTWNKVKDDVNLLKKNNYIIYLEP